LLFTFIEHEHVQLNREVISMDKVMKIYQEGLEESPKARIIFGNIMMLLLFALGTIACWFFNPIIAWIYLAFAVIMVGIVLRKLVCTNCYYYDKWCPMGWGKLAALLFKKGDINNFDSSIGMKLAPLTYGNISFIPMIFLIISIVQNFSVVKLIVLIMLITIIVFSATIGRKEACRNCKMRLLCPGAAVK
jgi:hypothetical protein